MTGTTRWVIDTDWTALTFTSGDLNSLASGGGAVSSHILNGSSLDQLMDVSFVVTVGGTTTTASYFTLYLLPLNQDGSTYGDGYASSTTTQPAAQYAVGSINVLPSVTSGNTVTGTISFINIPPGNFKLALGNNLGVALNSTAALTLSYRTYNTNLNV
jgi:hypothetical protein